MHLTGFKIEWPHCYKTLVWSTNDVSYNAVELGDTTQVIRGSTAASFPRLSTLLLNQVDRRRREWG